MYPVEVSLCIMVTLYEEHKVHLILCRHSGAIIEHQVVCIAHNFKKLVAYTL